MIDGDVLESFVQEVADGLDYSNDGAITCLGCVASTGFAVGVIGLIPDEIVIGKFAFEGSVDDWGAWPGFAFVVAFPAVLVVVHVDGKR